MNPPAAAKRILERYSAVERDTIRFDAPGAILYGIFNGLSLPLAGIVGRKLGMDADMLTVMGMSVFAGLLLNLWIGHASDRGNRVAWVLWPGIASRVAVALCGLWVSPASFLACMCVYNAVSTFGGPAYNSIMRSNYSDRYRGEIMGNIRILIQVVSAIAAAFTGWYMQSSPQGFRMLFPVAGAFGVVSSVVFSRVREASAPLGAASLSGAGAPDIGAPIEGDMPPRSAAGTAAGSAGFRESLRALLSDRRFVAFMGVYFVIGFPDKLLIPLEPIRLVDELGISYSMAGIVQGSIPLVACVLGNFAFSRLSHRVDPMKLLVATALLSSARFLNLAVATQPLQLIPGVALSGIANAGWDLLPLFTIGRFAGLGKLGFYYGFHCMLIGVRGIMGPLIGNWLYSAMGMPIVGVCWIAFGLELVGVAFLSVFWLRASGADRSRGSGNPGSSIRLRRT